MDELNGCAVHRYSFARLNVGRLNRGTNVRMHVFIYTRMHLYNKYDTYLISSAHTQFIHYTRRSIEQSNRRANVEGTNCEMNVIKMIDQKDLAFFEDD